MKNSIARIPTTSSAVAIFSAVFCTSWANLLSILAGAIEVLSIPSTW